MTDRSADELRAQWLRLQAEQAELRDRTRALQQSLDNEALREHTARLHEHNERLQALVLEMEKHHKAHGAIGGLPHAPRKPG